MSGDDLTETDRALLDIWAKSWTYPGHKETAVRNAAGLSMTRATQEINRLIDTEAALAYDPVTVNRLRRVRSRRQRSRTTRRT